MSKLVRGNFPSDQVRASHRQGDGVEFQMATGGFTPGNVLIYDANGNAIDSGSAPGVGGGGSGGPIINAAYGVPAGATTLPLTGWTLQNAGSAHGSWLDFIDNEIVMNEGNFGTQTYSALTRSISVPYTIYAYIQMRGFQQSPAQVSAFCISDGTKYEWFGVQAPTSGANLVLTVATLTSLNAAGVAVAGPTASLVCPTFAVKVVNDGTHRTFYYAARAGTWTQFLQENSGTFLTETKSGIISLNDVPTGGFAIETVLKAWAQ